MGYNSSEREEAAPSCEAFSALAVLGLGSPRDEPEFAATAKPIIETLLTKPAEDARFLSQGWEPHFRQRARGGIGLDRSPLSLTHPARASTTVGC
jgi:hypothetical protein